MRITLSQKLVGAFLGLTLLVLVATLGLARWSFQQGFLDYVNALEQTRLERLRDRLVDNYRDSDNGWAFLTQSRFGDMLRMTFDSTAMGAAPASGPPAPGAPRPPRGQRPPTPGPPTALYDAANELIVGDRLAGNAGDLVRVPIIIDGVLVAELRSELRRQLSSPQNTAFSKQQLMTSWAIGAAAMLLALVLSLVLARGLLAPVRRMLGDVARLSSGDYTVRLNEKRKDELGDLMRDLGRLAETLEEIRLSRRRLFADVSHELRTPLTILKGELEAMKDGVRAFDKTQLESLEQELGRLGFLVDDLYELSVSDVGGLRYVFSDVELSQCLRDVLNGMRERAQERGIQLQLEGFEKVTVNADLNRLDRLFQNLLENSLTHTDSPGAIKLSVKRQAGVAVVEIEDTPPGVSEHECARLFDPLYRRDTSRSRRTGGAGLGLAICRNIVHAHRGAICASPSELGGVRIQIRLPASTGQTQ